jgi:hypothetical protein
VDADLERSLPLRRPVLLTEQCASSSEISPTVGSGARTQGHAPRASVDLQRRRDVVLLKTRRRQIEMIRNLTHSSVELRGDRPLYQELRRCSMHLSALCRGYERLGCLADAIVTQTESVARREDQSVVTKAEERPLDQACIEIRELDQHRRVEGMSHTTRQLQDPSDVRRKAVDLIPQDFSDIVRDRSFRQSAIIPCPAGPSLEPDQPPVVHVIHELLDQQWSVAGADLKASR